MKTIAAVQTEMGRKLVLDEQPRMPLKVRDFDGFLVAFNPGPQWHYFPSVSEIFVTLGIIATEVLGYVLIAKRFPIMTGVGGAAGRRPTTTTTYARGVA